jgi:hypothetical protein
LKREKEKEKEEQGGREREGIHYRLITIAAGEKRAQSASV